MGISRVTISASDMSHILAGILDGDDDGFEEAIENGFDEIEFFIDALKESDRDFTLEKYTY